MERIPSGKERTRSRFKPGTLWICRVTAVSSSSLFQWWFTR